MVWPTRTSARRRQADADRQVLRGIAWRTALQSALLVAVTFLLCGGVVVLVVTASARRSIDSQLASAANRAVDDVADAAVPPGTYLLVLPPQGPAIRTPGTPAVLPERAGLAAVEAGRASIVHELDTPHGEFLVRTQASSTPSGRQVVQAAQSLGPEHAERARLLTALAAAGVVALGGAAALGAMTGRRSVSDLVDTLRRQRTFVADASHELRTPLTALSTRAQLLRRHIAGLELPEHQARGLLADADRLLRDSGRMNEVVEDLLLAAEPVQDRDATADLAETAGDAVASATALAAASGVLLSLEHPASAVQVRGATAALRRSLLALLDNAIRHTPSGGRVTVTVERASALGTVQVSDSGLGIPPALEPHLFERCSSSAAESARTGGQRRYGLGLALVADTAHRFGGTVQVDSTSAGARFTLGLPLVGADPAKPG